eukprot:TRINITY_DN136263_c0_g1_i1.p1 TRINITY_DN136263_c0_g1~~TRINITY_DN136263_c0_g1_i1.p1  ORF type:complete len:129 (-),score=44.12 TRINITY_DN136263_c0_g1_i1:15-401(-)
MARDQPSSTQSLVISGLLFFITLSGLQIFATKLASTPQLTIVGGFVSSLLFFFLLIFIGSLEYETKWIEVVFSMFVAMVAASTVHRVCVTTCFIFSVILLAYMNNVSKAIGTRNAAALLAKEKPKKKN